MSTPTVELVRALRTTARRLRAGAPYRWTHLGACNCGHLAQVLTRQDPETLRRFALQKAGEWAQQAVEHCPSSGYPIDHVLSVMREVGLEPEDIGHLERLSHPRVLRRLPPGERDLDFRRRGDVVRFMETWAELLEAELAELGRPVPEGPGPLPEAAEGAPPLDAPAGAEDGLP